MGIKLSLAGALVAVSLLVLPIAVSASGHGEGGGEDQCLYVLTDGCEYDMRGFHQVELEALTPFTAAFCYENGEGGEYCNILCHSFPPQIGHTGPLTRVYVGWLPGSETDSCPRPPVADVTIRWA